MEIKKPPPQRVTCTGLESGTAAKAPPAAWAMMLLAAMVIITVQRGLIVIAGCLFGLHPCGPVDCLFTDC